MLKALEDSSRPKLQFLLLAAIILILCFICYGPAMNAEINWDDPQWLTENPSVTHTNISWIWKSYRATSSYYPLTPTSFWVEYKIWGDWLAGYRLTNILLHAASALMLWKILTKLKVPGATFAAILWAIHPLQAETVVWIAERKNTLSGVFFFAAMLTWMRFVEAEANKRAQWIAIVSTFFLLACALLAKGSTVFFPVAALGISWMMVGRLHRREILFSIPLFAAALTMGLITMHFEKYAASAGFGPDWELSVGQRMILVGRCFWFYIEKMLWPNPLSFVYPRWELHADQPMEYLGFVSGIALFAVLGWLAWKKKIVRPLIGLTLFLAAIFPVIGVLKFFTQLFTYVADHYSYLANAASITLVVSVLFSAWEYTKNHPEKFKLPAWLAPVTCLSLIFAATTISCGQSLLYRSFLASWEESLRVSPKAWIARNAIGEYLFARLNRDDEALEHFKEALKSSRDARLLVNMGMILEKRGQHDQAKAFYQEAIDKHAGSHIPYVRMSLYAIAEKNPKKAIEYCNLSLDYNEHNPIVWAVLGDALREDGQLEQSAAAYIKCLQLRPDAQNVHLVLGDLAYELGKYPESVNLYQQARDRDPNNPYVRTKLAAVLRKLGHEQEARLEDAYAKEIRARYGAASQREPLTQPAWRDVKTSVTQPSESQPTQ